MDKKALGEKIKDPARLAALLDEEGVSDVNIISYNGTTLL